MSVLAVLALLASHNELATIRVEIPEVRCASWPAERSPRAPDRPEVHRRVRDARHGEVPRLLRQGPVVAGRSKNATASARCTVDFTAG